MERTLIVAVLIGMLAMILVLSGRVDDMSDRVQKLEQITNRQNIEGARHEERAREIVSSLPRQNSPL